MTTGHTEGTERATTVRKIADLMRQLDFCMFATRAADGRMHARPMSNNGEVEFDGDVWFFSGADTRKVAEIEADAHVQLSYADITTFRFLSLSGDAAIVRDPKQKRALWMSELERWFPDGPESEGVVLIRVTPSVVAYWNGEDEGELTLG